MSDTKISIETQELINSFFDELLKLSNRIKKIEDKIKELEERK